MCGEDVLRLLPVRIRCMVEKLKLDFSRLWEIRLRVNSPFILRYEDSEIYVDSRGMKTDDAAKAYIVTARDVNDTLECVCNHSLYAYEDEIRQGFVTVCGGHRVGVAGKIILDGNRIKCIRHISFLNIRAVSYTHLTLPSDAVHSERWKTSEHAHRISAMSWQDHFAQGYHKGGVQQRNHGGSCR